MPASGRTIPDLLLVSAFPVSVPPVPGLVPASVSRGHVGLLPAPGRSPAIRRAGAARSSGRS